MAKAVVSKYEGIKTAKELIHEAALNGFSTKEDDIVRAQDIFGHSTVGELDELANSTEPAGHQTERDIFYWIAFKIWSWEDATRFWNLHTNPDHKALDEQKELNLILKTQNKKLEEQLKAAQDKLVKMEMDLAEYKHSTKVDASELQAKELEIMKLKARLFDLMDGKAA